MATFTQIGNAITVSGTTTTQITFSSIPNTYTDICILFSGRSNKSPDARDGLHLFFNNSTGSGYSGRELRGYDNSSIGSTTSSTSYLDMMRMPSAGSTGDTFTNISFYIPNYAGSNYKSVSIDAVGQEVNSTSSWYIDLAAGLWSSSSAITQVDLRAETGYFVPNTTAYLYGVSNA